MGRFAACAIAAALLTTPALAQKCQSYAAWQSELREQVQGLVWRGIANERWIIELWLSPGNESWTILALRPDGIACSRAVGDSYELPVIRGRIGDDRRAR